MPSTEEGKSKGRSSNKGASQKPKSSTRPKTDITPKVVNTKVTEAPTVTKTVSSDGANSSPDASNKPTMVGAMVGAMRQNSEFRGGAFKVGLVAVGLLLVVIVVFGVLIYGFKSNNSAVQAVAEVVPYPAESVNGQWIRYSAYLSEVNAEERSIQYNAKLNNQPSPNFNGSSGKKMAQQIKQHALQKLAQDTLVDQLAAKNGVKVTSAQVQAPINDVYAQYGGKSAVLKVLNQIYGWNLNDFQHSVRQQLLQQDLANKISNNASYSAASKAKAQNMLEQLKSGADFSTLAKANSQSSDASSGGNMGYFAKGQVPNEIYSAAAALQPGQLSGVIHDQYGYVIIKVLATKPGGSIEAQEILIKNVDYNSYFAAQQKKAKINTFIKV